MGRKVKWLGAAVKKAFSPPKKSNNLRRPTSFQQWVDGASSSVVAAADEEVHPACADDSKLLVEERMNEKNKCTHSVPVAAHDALNAIGLMASNGFAGKSVEEIAAIKIQTAFRGHLARKGLRALRGMVRLEQMVHSDTVKQQATTTLRCMQKLSKLQPQIRTRRIRMSEENQAFQRQLLLKRQRELQKLHMGEEWNDSLQSKEQIEANLLSKQEAAMRREKSLAYAFSHQKSSSKSVYPHFTNPQWGWSWLERWMAARPWENRSTATDIGSDYTSVKSVSRLAIGEISKTCDGHHTSLDPISPAAHKLGSSSSCHFSIPACKAVPLEGRIKHCSLRNEWVHIDDESISTERQQFSKYQGHSAGELSVGSLSVPNYMTPTKSTRAKIRFRSPGDKTDP